MKIPASHLLARYQSQTGSSRPNGKPPAAAPSQRAARTQPITSAGGPSAAAAETISAVEPHERSFIAELLATADGSSLPAGVSELAKGTQVDISA
jgi:hypothetical protein